MSVQGVFSSFPIRERTPGGTEEVLKLQLAK